MARATASGAATRTFGGRSFEQECPVTATQGLGIQRAGRLQVIEIQHRRDSSCVESRSLERSAILAMPRMGRCGEGHDAVEIHWFPEARIVQPILSVKGNGEDSPLRV